MIIWRPCLQLAAFHPNQQLLKNGPAVCHNPIQCLHWRTVYPLNPVFSLKNGSSVNPSLCAEEQSIRLSSSFPVLALKNGISVNPVFSLKNGSSVNPSLCAEERSIRLSSSFPVLALKNGIPVNPVLSLKNGLPVNPSFWAEERFIR